MKAGNYVVYYIKLVAIYYSLLKLAHIDRWLNELNWIIGRDWFVCWIWAEEECFGAVNSSAKSTTTNKFNLPAN